MEGELSQRARQRAAEICHDADLRMVAPRNWVSSGVAVKQVPTHSGAKTHHDRRIPVPGTQLSREYRGTPIVVNVLTDGFEYQGRPYRSLSAIASEVTGTRWNGLAFFRLTADRNIDKGVRHAGKR